jgi:hypothetical protein
VIAQVFLAALLAASALRAEATLQAYGEIPASAKDSLGDTIGGIGSAIAYDPKTGDVFMMPDRGAGDGSIDYRPRCYRIKITPSANDPKHLDCQVEETILFRDQKGRPFTGLLSDIAATPTRNGRRCLDSEAIAIAPDGTIYVSDEYAPALLQFSRDGHLLREIPLPDWYRPRDRQGRIDYQSKTVTGREDNRGCEAMGILPDGKHAVLILQSALLQDGGKSAGTSRVLILDLRSGQPTAEYAYAFADPTAWPHPLKFKDLSVNDLTVVDQHTLLVLERDDLGRDGPLVHSTARSKAVWRVDLRAATNLLELPGAPFAQSPAQPAFKPLSRNAKVRFVQKTLLFNLPDLTAQLGIPAEKLAAKWEGITLIPPRSNRGFHLLMSADNDFLNPTLHFNGVTTKFPRAQDTVPTQIFEIFAPSR